MKTHSPHYERIKRQYFVYLKEAKRHSEDPIDGVAKALNRFKTYTKFRDFKTFLSQEALAFKKHLAEQESAVSGERLSLATRNATFPNLKRFFQWLAWQPGFKSCLSYSDAEYFNLSEKDTRVANANQERPVPMLKQITLVIVNCPVKWTAF
ncbi:MAG: hypothetical protein ABIU05_13555 [Nitrospirales bacterium]